MQRPSRRRERCFGFGVPLATQRGQRLGMIGMFRCSERNDKKAERLYFLIDIKWLPRASRCNGLLEDRFGEARGGHGILAT